MNAQHILIHLINCRFFTYNHSLLLATLIDNSDFCFLERKMQTRVRRYKLLPVQSYGQSRKLAQNLAGWGTGLHPQLHSHLGLHRHLRDETQSHLYSAQQYIILSITAKTDVGTFSVRC